MLAINYIIGFVWVIQFSENKIQRDQIWYGAEANKRNTDFENGPLLAKDQEKKLKIKFPQYGLMGETTGQQLKMLLTSPF